MSLYAGYKTQACAALFETTSGRVIYPFLLRDLGQEPFWRPEALQGPAYDIVTPYGYGGPVMAGGLTARTGDAVAAEAVAPPATATPTRTDGQMEAATPPAGMPQGAAEPSHEEKKKLFQRFYVAFHDWARANHVVSEFVRFSLFTEATGHYYGRVEHNNDNIVCDLQRHDGGVAGNFERKVHKNVRTALRHGLRVEADMTGERTGDFLEVYEAAMRRRGAAPFYFFGRGYFRRLMERMAGSAVMFHVLQGDLVVASELVLLSATRVYSFLGGTLESHFHTRASDLLKHQIVLWAQEKGFRQFVIGGGFRPHDGIYAFKKSFAPEGVVPFYTGKMIFDSRAYGLLAGDPDAGLTAGFFPAYREGR